MKRIAKVFLISFVGSIVICTVSGCFGGGGGDSTDYIPTWISASWWGGATGNPTDRRDEEAVDWVGSICPASSLSLTNHNGSFAGICIVNSCTSTITMGICRTKGSSSEGELQNYECADDPFYTPFLRLYPLSLNPGTDGYCINAPEEMSINIFYCSDEQMLNALDTPLRCL